MARRWALRLLLAALALGAMPSAVGATALARLPVGATIDYRSDPLRSYLPLIPQVNAVGRTLLLADTPELVRGAGLIYRAPVAGPFRVFLYAVDAARLPLYFAVVVRNRTRHPATIEVTRAGIGGPSSEFFGVGTLAQVHYFASARRRAIRILVPAGGGVFLDPALESRPAHPGQLVNAIIDASTAPAALWVSVVAERRPTTVMRGLKLLPPGSGPLMRGTFPTGDFDVTAAVKGGRHYVLVGNNPRYLHGYSLVDHRITTDYGNYGALYDLRVYVTPARAGRLTLLFAGRGTRYQGLAFLSQDGAGRAVALGGGAARALTAHDAVVLAQEGVRTGRTSVLDLQWMPAGASSLPAAFLLNG